MTDMNLVPTPPDPLHDSNITQPELANTRMIVINPKSFWDRRILGLLESRQGSMTFNPHPKDVEKMKHPSEYLELKGMDVKERVITTETDRNGKPTATITLWEHKGNPKKEHYILFNGKTGHIADIGALPEGISDGGYDSERGINLKYLRHGGLDFLKELASDGAGFTVITVRGYGNNLGTPSEEGFKRDIKAYLEDRKEQSKVPGAMTPADSTVIAGVSLGSGLATDLAVEMTRRGEPPAMLDLVNPYKRFVVAADHTLRSQPFKHATLNFIPFAEEIKKVAFDIPRDVLEKVLRTSFKIDEGIAELRPDTSLLLITSGKDPIIPPANSTDLLQIAQDAGIHAQQCLYKECGHHNIPLDLSAHDMKTAYQQHVLRARSHILDSIDAPADKNQATMAPITASPKIDPLGEVRFAMATPSGKNFVLTFPKGIASWADAQAKRSETSNINGQNL